MMTSSMWVYPLCAKVSVDSVFVCVYLRIWADSTAQQFVAKYREQLLSSSEINSLSCCLVRPPLSAHIVTVRSHYSVAGGLNLYQLLLCLFINPLPILYSAVMGLNVSAALGLNFSGASTF